ncbi:MAG: enoyl-CoA hydratase/isomerase family protein [Ktedonobacteraceae bacterium]|nr:enoyl-CoA hydratase/isomerase family protein [Ktedonobacteraceae bacterium]
MSNLILTDSAGSIATLTLNRPERHNSLIPELLREMLDALDSLRARSDVRVVVLRANGRSFSTGGDVRAFADHQADIETYAREVVGLLNQIIISLINLPVPLVAAVHGLVTGGALGFVLAADIVLVAPEARFQPYYTTVGYSPDGGWTALLPRIIGFKRAAEVQLLNQAITAEQAVAWGLASRLVPAHQLEDEARTVAEAIARQLPGSVRRTRQLLWDALPSLVERLDAERDSFVEQIATIEACEGMRAFLNNRR